MGVPLPGAAAPMVAVKVTVSPKLELVGVALPWAVAPSFWMVRMYGEPRELDLKSLSPL